MEIAQRAQRVYAQAGKWALVLGVLSLTSLYSYLLFHTSAEIFSAAVALAIFLLIWNVRRLMDNSYLLLVGVAYLFVGALDLLHTLAYKGMGIFGPYEEDLPTQLWIGVRYMQSISLLIAPFLIGKRLNIKFVVAAYVLASSLLLGAIFYWEVFPVCFVPGKGLTPFKVLSEYAISLILLAAIALLARNWKRFDPAVFRLLAFSMAFTIVSELSFTLYADVHGVLNFIGHFFKIIAFYCVYKAIVELGVARPFAVLFRNLLLSEEALRSAHDNLERKVQERTAELVKTLEQLRESETKYRTVAHNTHDWEWWRDQENKFVYISPSCKEITHHTTEDFFADPDMLSKIIHPDDRSSFAKHMEEVENTRLSGEAEFRILRPDGSVRWIAHACLPVFGEHGRFLGHRGSNRDITERKEAEKALRSSEERHRALIETMSEGFGIADKRGVWTYVNESFCKMAGYPCEEIIGRPVYEWLDEANRRILDEQMSRRRMGEHKPYEIAGIKKDGSPVYALVSPKPIFGEAGQFEGTFAVIMDITERKKAEESLQKALAEVRTLKDRLEAENIYFRREMKAMHQHSHIIGESNAIKYILYRAEQVAPSNTTVLILGETGTGKDLIASAIHRMSPRKDQPLITLNCAVLPANLMESELFGREKGAFTGADSQQLGRFEVADGSTLCLDEIGELPLELQAKLLQVLQHGEFERLGSSRTIRVDVRIVATTNRNLEEEVRKGRFRQDLFYRLNVFPITVPPLRQRKTDIPLLVQAVTERYAKHHGKEFTSIQSEMMNSLQGYDWPGNIRELENVIERAVILCPGPVLQMVDKFENACSPSFSFRTLEETERDQILNTLQETRWRINGKDGAAAILGLNPSTLRSRMHKLGIHRPDVRT